MKKRENKPLPTAQKLVVDVDYYIENGLYVFTEKYLRNRGFCCQSGCRHCPYGFKKDSKARFSADSGHDFPQK